MEKRKDENEGPYKAYGGGMSSATQQHNKALPLRKKIFVIITLDMSCLHVQKTKLNEASQSSIIPNILSGLLTSRVSRSAERTKILQAGRAPGGVRTESLARACSSRRSSAKGESSNSRYDPWGKKYFHNYPIEVPLASNLHSPVFSLPLSR